MKVSLIFPTYNEVKNIPLLFAELHVALQKVDVEYIVVDDNSPDGTADAAEALQTLYPVRVIRRPGKAGLGSAVRAGFLEAKGDIIGVMDADLSHNPDIVPALIQAIERDGVDIAIGSRFQEESAVEQWVWWRKALSNTGVWLARRLTSVTDPLSGFFMMKRSVIDGVVLTTVGYKILLEILVKGHYTTVREFSYVFRVRKYSSSKLDKRELFRFVHQLWWYSWYRLTH